MRGLIILSDGFEDVEAIATIDILRRSNIKVVTSSLENKQVTSSHNIKIESEILLKDAILNEYDFLILPGGPHVFNKLEASNLVKEVIMHFATNRKLIAAICAAPRLLGLLNLLENERYVCFKGCNEGITNGKYLPNKKVVASHYIITARSMYYTNLFALEIIKYLQGKEIKKTISKQIKGE